MSRPEELFSAVLFNFIVGGLPRTNARMGRVDRNWTKSGGRPYPMAGGFVSG